MADISIGAAWPIAKTTPQPANTVRRIVRRWRVLRRRWRRDRFERNLIATLGPVLAADIGIDLRRHRRYDWFGALVRGITRP